MSHVGDDNPDAPDAALLGPAMTATGGGTSPVSIPESPTGDDHIPPLDRSAHDDTAAAESAD
ncbi:hypothetical protein L1277_002577 [Okibacterium sp. HSC-33S16]|uniref:hypothetical protein n=1 Tax=Okibacterium sp. HSC-33S16 TaxID=2910965 RepID=UPI00209DCBB4|nr:hypothetical protein [Okibacterium sp. HSC-33S16]MCP2032474.1 hypothetical protein [Okibacterium sp. HSC-33S16]